jgi:hypothetical protein
VLDFEQQVSRPIEQLSTPHILDDQDVESAERQLDNPSLILAASRSSERVAAEPVIQSASILDANMKKPTPRDKSIAKRWRWAFSISGISEFIVVAHA